MKNPEKNAVTCLLWGFCAYNMLPMELKITSDVFQEAMEELFADMEKIVVRIDDVLIIGIGTFEEHLATVEEVLKRLNEKEYAGQHWEKCAS